MKINCCVVLFGAALILASGLRVASQETIAVTTWTNVTPATNVVWSNAAPLRMIDSNQVYVVITSQNFYRMIYTNGVSAVFVSNLWVPGSNGVYYGTNDWVTNYSGLDRAQTYSATNIVRRWCRPEDTNWVILSPVAVP